jgi:methylase of polypeptide subunit release factors
VSETGPPAAADQVALPTDRPAVTFGELRVAYAPSVLTPRAWTVAQSEWAVDLGRELPEGPILELCSGSGQIGLLAAVRSRRRLVAVDVNEVAVECARQNARDAGIADLVEVRCGSIESALAEHETFPLIIADPPWVPNRELSKFPLDPPLAIDGGEDGMRLALACVDVIDQHLRPDGAALLQLGSRDQVRRLSEQLSTSATRLVVTARRSFGSRGEIARLDRPGD